MSKLKNDKKECGVLVLGGIHGSGKSTFATMLQQDYPELKVLKASEILNHDANHKKGDSIENNKILLAKYISEQKKNHKWLLIDGHYSLIDKDGIPKFVGNDVFAKISPDLLILMDTDANFIQRNRLERDNEKITIEEIKKHSDFERQIALELAIKFDIDLISIETVL